jgi:hypothetical protein
MSRESSDVTFITARPVSCTARKCGRYGPGLYDQADLQLVTTAIRLSPKLRKTVDDWARSRR